MPIFEIVGTDGKVYEVGAPDRDSAIRTYRTRQSERIDIEPLPSIVEGRAQASGRTNLDEFRKRYPQYDDMSDSELADSLYRKFYSDMPRAKFDAATVADRSSGQVLSGPKIRMPDGQIVRFPADMPKAGINSLIRRRYGLDSKGNIARGGPSDEIGRLEGLARAGLKGATMSAGDHVVAAGAAAIHPLVHGESGKDFGERYQAYLSRERAKRGRFREKHPVASGAAEVGGALATLVPAASTRLGSAALGVTGKNLLSRSAASSLSGAAIGGIDASLSGGDTARGAMTGAAIGALVPAAGSAVGAGVRRGLSVSPSKTTRAGQMAARAMTDDALTPATARARLSAMGDDAMLADLGPNLTQQAAGIASLPSRGQQVVRDALAARQANAGARVTATLDEVFGGSVNLAAERAKLAAARQADFSPLYDAARHFTGKLQADHAYRIVADGLQTAVGKKRTALRRIERMLTESLSPSSKYAGLKSSAAALHEVRSEISRGMRNEWRDIAGQLKPILKALDNQLDIVPGYAKARAGWADSKAIEEALEQGRTVFRRSVRPDDLAGELAAMSQPEQEAFRQGARDVVSEIMGTARNDAAAAWRELAEKGWNREKLQLVVGKRAADKLAHRLNTEKLFAQTSARITQNSETAARQAAQRELTGRGLPEEPVSAWGRAIESIPGAGPLVRSAFNNLRGRTRAAVNVELARLLTATGQDRRASIDRVATLLSMSNRAVRKGEIARLLTQTTLVGAQAPSR